jgi:hypothetical protein
LKINRIVLAFTLALLGTFAVFAPGNLHAQTNSDISRNAFQVTVPINVNNFTETPVTIPAGKRLVVQDVSLAGAAQANPYVVPIIILSTSINSGAVNNRYFSPTPYPTDPTQFYADMPTTLYADTLNVSPAFAGYTPTFMSFNVVITGYLVDLPK